jgi:hypothetical protein
MAESKESIVLTIYDKPLGVTPIEVCTQVNLREGQLAGIARRALSCACLLLLLTELPIRSAEITAGTCPYLQAMRQSPEEIKVLKARYVEAARKHMDDGDNDRLERVMWECNRLWRAVFTLSPDEGAVSLLNRFRSCTDAMCCHTSALALYMSNLPRAASSGHVHC